MLKYVADWESGFIQASVQVVEHDRLKLIQIEKIILGTICYNFTSRLPFKYVIKIGRALRGVSVVSGSRLRLSAAYRSHQETDAIGVAVGCRLVRRSSDRLNAFFFTLLSYRTLLPLQYPPHTIALGSLYVAALLSSFDQPPSAGNAGFRSPHEVGEILKKHGDWEKKFKSQVEDLEGTCYHALEVLII